MKLHIFAALLSILFLASCQKQDIPATDNPEQEQEQEQSDPQYKKLGSYEYGGEEYPIFSTLYAENDYQIALVVSPLSNDRPITTYAAIIIKSELEGLVIDVNRAWHNDDYIFTYEDPVKYYSKYHALKSGTIMIKKLATPGHYNIEVDVVLPDHTPFKLSYSGEFSSAE